MSNFKQLDLTEFHHLRAQLDIKKDQVPHHNYYSGATKLYSCSILLNVNYQKLSAMVTLAFISIAMKLILNSWCWPSASHSYQRYFEECKRSDKQSTPGITNGQRICLSPQHLMDLQH